MMGTHKKKRRDEGGARARRPSFLRFFLCALPASLAIATSGCGVDEGVIRVVDGDVMITHFVPAEAYAAFLAGTLAEADGRLTIAQGRYRDALSIDDRDPLVWARLGDVTCRLSASNREADAAFKRALAIDPSSASAREALSACAERRKDLPGATSSALAAAADDPRRPELDARANTLLAQRTADSARARILASTRTFGDRPEAWEALLNWSLDRHDAFLVVTAVKNLLAVRRSHVASGVRAAIALAGWGAIEEARAVSRVTLEAKEDGHVIDPLVARLAVDSALSADDVAGAQALAAKGHVPLGEVGARAYLLGKTDAARKVAQEVADADGGDVDAAAVRAMTDATRAVAPPPAREISAAAWVALTESLLVRVGRDAASAFAGRSRRASLDGRDALVVDRAVELAAAGVLAPETDAERVELALRRAETPRLLPGLDERHELVARLLGGVERDDARTKRLIALLSPGLGRDPLVTFALVERARRANAVTQEQRDLLLRAPAHPLTLALRVELADAAQKSTEQGKLRAVARTQAEEKLSGM
jgi:tetratricopeptide (TPR) repeat protein